MNLVRTGTWQHVGTLLPELDVLLHPRADFESAARAVLSFLREQLQLDMAVVSRRVGSHYVVLFAEDSRWNVQDRDVLTWNDTFCARMADGRAPMIAPRVDDVPAFVEARALLGTDMQAYVTVPMLDAEGEITGTLCGASSRSKGEDFPAQLPMVRLLGELLSNLLDYERQLAAALRTAEQANMHARTDALTGLGNRRHWDAVLDSEAKRFRRYANSYGVIVVDLDCLKAVNDEQGHAAGDELICLTAEILRASVRPSDTVARLGGDEFGVLAIECESEAAVALEARLMEALNVAGVQASIGAGVVEPGDEGPEAWIAADRAMYQAKIARKMRSVSPG